MLAQFHKKFYIDPLFLRPPFQQTKNGLHKKCTHYILPCHTAVQLVLKVNQVLLSG